MTKNERYFIIVDMSKATIVAAMTPPLKSAVGMIRLSGPESIVIIKKITGKENFDARVATRVTIDIGEIKDDCIVTVFREPKSFTGEDVVEISCHGNPLLIERIIDYCIFLGAAYAERGEFSKRAFYNGKLDLTAAEGIDSLINATSERQLKNAYRLAEGELAKRIRRLQKDVTDVSAAIEAAVDYPEEETDAFNEKATAQRLEKIIGDVDGLIKTYESGSKIKNGVKVVISGKPNVGKSTLFNRLIGREGAIVTNIAGTTRDVIKDYYEYKGLVFELYDTAGLRETEDIVEKIGVEKSLQAAAAADIEIRLYENGEEIATGDDKIFYVRSKCDKEKDDSGSFAISAKTGKNIERLKEELFRLAGITADDTLMIDNRRQYSAFLAAAEALKSALKALEKEPADCVLSELDFAYDSLGTVTGHKGSEEKIDRLFAEFCVGK